MFCEYCGQKISSRAKFCSKCGKSQDEESVLDSQNLVVSQANSQEISNHLLMYKKFNESFCGTCGYSGVMGIRRHPFEYPAYGLACIVVVIMTLIGAGFWPVVATGCSMGLLIGLTLRDSAICPNCEVLSRSSK